MESSGMDRNVEIAITPETDDDPGEDRWLGQVAGLYDDLRNNGIPLREESTPVPGQKGDVSTVIAALGSAGAFTAAVAVFRAWLERARSRRLRVGWKVGEEWREVVITGDTDNATLERIAQEAMRQSSKD
jgi:Effector Associated Constant Component 1